MTESGEDLLTRVTDHVVAAGLVQHSVSLLTMTDEQWRTFRRWAMNGGGLPPGESPKWEPAALPNPMPPGAVGCILNIPVVIGKAFAVATRPTN